MLGQRHPNIALWARRKQVVDSIQLTKQNECYLPGIRLPDTVFLTDDLAEAVFNAQIVVITTPSHAVRETATHLAKLVANDAIIVTAVKGLELESHKRMSEVIAEIIPSLANRIAAISGPNHAEEVGLQYPSTSVVASPFRSIANGIQDIFMMPYFRVYTNPDIVGVELGGALKNIIALGAGIAEGLGFGDNTKAALMTRGLAEITRLGMAMHATPLTFAGLSGIGDLIVTCTSQHSRNRRAGLLVAQGKTIQEIETESCMVVEGIKATMAAHQLAQKYGIEMPITEQTFQVLYKDKHPQEAVLDLMSRGCTHETEEVVIDEKEWKNW
jgi:glycerol-3-phosphate dehydrogenase (NAD(P)+)